jgi:hypothetical protein
VRNVAAAPRRSRAGVVPLASSANSVSSSRARMATKNAASPRASYTVAMAYRYRPEVIDALARHGIAPGPGTAPPIIRDQLNDLYRYEIRRLKRRLLAGEFPRAEYLDRVLTLRGRYLLLSMPVNEWTLAADE